MMAEKDNWIMLAIGGALIAILGFFSLGKTVNVSAGQASAGPKPSCGCGG